MQRKFEQLKARLMEVDDIWSAVSVLSWDHEVSMPPGGAVARGRHMATLGRLAHQKFTSAAIGRLLDALQPWADGLPYDSDEASLVRVARREYERETRVPTSFVAREVEHATQTYTVWAQARPKNDFAAVCPYLEKTLELSREYSSFFPGCEHVIDPHIDRGDYGVKASALRVLFGRLRDALVPMVAAITSQAPADDSCLHRTYPGAQQKEFFEQMMRQVGYDFDRGRVEVSPHPFTTKFSVGDVRFTVRYQPNDLGEALFGFLHEGGHALYEQGVDGSLEGTLLAGGTSSGVHESQSRLWENTVGRSRGFWSYWYPRLQAFFPQQLGDVPLDVFYRAINKVQRSLIRTEADEVTYNLHVMIRFGLEMDLLEGKLAIRDLPEAWREQYGAYLGIIPPDDRDGVLQDVHWYGGTIGGMFQGYTLGNILGAQFYAAALHDHPEIPGEVASGRCDTLLGWLRDQIYRHGSKFSAPELTERVTGGPMQIEPYVAYLRAKYGELYEL
jgi:carboxypeptidase Taq